MGWSLEVRRLFDWAEQAAIRLGEALSSGHLLLAFFYQKTRASLLLKERGLDADQIVTAFNGLAAEDPAVVEEIRSRSQRFAEHSKASEVDSFHLLFALIRTDCCAKEALQRCKIQVSDLRAYLAGVVNRTSGVRANLGLEKQRTHDDGIVALSRHPTDSLLDTVKLHPPQGPIVRSGTTAPTIQAVQGPTMRAGGSASSVTPSGIPFGRGRTPPIGVPSFGTAPTVVQEKAGAEGEQGVSPEVRKKLEQGVLCSERFPVLSHLGRNLTQMARAGGLDRLVGRNQEIEKILDILGKRKANSPCLIGESGVGKTALVEGLASRIAEGSIGSMVGKVIVEIPISQILAGSRVRGSLAERLKSLREEIQGAEGQIILFFDEIHLLAKLGASDDGGQIALGEIKAAIGQGNFPCIGATTPKEYKEAIEADPVLRRRFQPLRLSEPTAEETYHILRGLSFHYERSHRVSYAKEAFLSAIHLAERFLPETHFPAKALDLIDEAGSRVRRLGQRDVLARHIAQIVAEKTGIPLGYLLLEDRERLLRMEDLLGRKIIGHKEEIAQIAQTIRRNYAGFRGQRPIGSFLFLGPTGVGKTETAKQLAEFLFHKPNLTRIDCSEYREDVSVNRLIGAAPGYVGYEEGGQLTEAIREKPYSIVLFDEIEKAHRSIWMILLQLLDEGHLTDTKGRRVSFSNCVIILTSNLGSEAFQTAGGIGFQAKAEETKVCGKRALEIARRHLPTELWMRIDAHLMFAPLGEEDLRQIARLLLARSSERLREQTEISYSVEPSVLGWLLEQGGFHPEYGARPMRSLIQRMIESRLADWILQGDIRRGDRITLSLSPEREIVFSSPRVSIQPLPSACTPPPLSSEIRAPIAMDVTLEEGDLLALPFPDD